MDCPPAVPGVIWALVTGAAGRGGAAIARALHARGLDVVIHHSPRSQAEADALAAELQALRAGSAQTWCADFAQAGLAVPDWLLALSPQVLVCNASAFARSGIGDQDRKHADWRIHVDAHAVILAALLPALPGLGKLSLQSVVAVTDIHVARPSGGYVWYTVAKAGLQALMAALAVDWAPAVRFNTVQPGTLPFPADWTDAQRVARITDTIPMRRLGSFEELAKAVVWLALDADYVTGQVLAVDGGRSRHLV